MKKYIVREGDTMWKVSKATGVRLNLLMAANPQVKDANQLQPGSVLSIPELGKDATGPTASGSSSAHTAPAGSGASGAKPAGPGTTGPGTAATGSGKPTPGSSSGSEAPYFGFVWPHVVKSGENWQSIAKTYNVPVDSLQRMNPRQSGQLQAGDIVYVPGAAGQVPGGPGAGQGHIDPTTGAPTSAPSGGTYDQQPQQPGWPMMQPAQAPGMASQPGGGPGMPQMPGYAGGGPGMPQMPGYAGGGPGMPQMPGYAGGGPGMPQMPGYAGGAPGMPGYAGADGPHTHLPYRSPWYDAMALPPYPVYVPAPPEGRYAVGAEGSNGAVYTPAGMSPEVSYRMWLESQQLPRGWNADWDESSAWESSWSSAFPPDQPGFDSGGQHRSASAGPAGNSWGGTDGGRTPDTWHWPDAFGAKDGVRDTPESSS